MFELSLHAWPALWPEHAPGHLHVTTRTYSTGAECHSCISIIHGILIHIAYTLSSWRIYLSTESVCIAYFYTHLHISWHQHRCHIRTVSLLHGHHKKHGLKLLLTLQAICSCLAIHLKTMKPPMGLLCTLSKDVERYQYFLPFDTNPLCSDLQGIEHYAAIAVY